MHCTDDIEIIYYSAVADIAIEDVICDASGAKLSSECMGKYIEEKAIHSQVFPTCGQKRCAKFNAKLFMSKRAGKVDKKWKDEQRMRKSQKAKKFMEDAAQELNDMELEVDSKVFYVEKLHIQGRRFSQFTQVVWSPIHESHSKGYVMI